MLVTACLAFVAGFAVLTLRFPGFVVLALIGIAWVNSRRWRGSGWAHGQARLATWLDAFYGGLLADSGPILGRTTFLSRPSRGQAARLLFRPFVPSLLACRMFFAAFKSQRGNDMLLRPSRYVHLATFAPTGAGKGVSVIIPTLLAESSRSSSFVVTDPKGENFRITADARRRLGNRVIRLDPFGLCGPGADTFNPLDFIDHTSPEFIEQVRALANCLVIRTGQEKEPHWNESAEIVISAAIAFCCATEQNPEERNLQLVRDIVSSRDKFMKMRDAMQKMTGFHGVLSRLGGMCSCYVGDELGGVLSTVQRHTAFLDGPIVAASTRRSSFDPKVLRQGTTLYLILPHNRLNTLAGLMRLWVTGVLQRLTEGVPSEQNPVTFILDEAAHLGRINALYDAVTLMRGMGIRLWFFFQSLGQLKEVYGDKADTFLHNMGTQQWFSINAYESAEYLSKRIGDASIVVEGFNRTTQRSRPENGGGKDDQRSISTSTSVNYSETGRRVLKSEEVLTLPPDTALIFHGSMPPVAARLLRYYDAPEFKRRRNGASRGLGLAAGMWCVMLLISGVFVAIGAAVIPDPQPQRTYYVPPPLPAANGSPRPASRGIGERRVEPGDWRYRPVDIRGSNQQGSVYGRAEGHPGKDRWNSRGDLSRPYP